MFLPGELCTLQMFGLISEIKQKHKNTRMVNLCIATRISLEVKKKIISFHPTRICPLSFKILNTEFEAQPPEPMHQAGSSHRCWK